MFGYLLLLFTVVPAIELILIIEVGQRIGSMNTLALIVFTGIVGASLARWQGFIVLQKIQTNVNSGKMPSDELFDGIFILIGGIVLLTPGFFTDFLGLVCLVPFTRFLMKRGLKSFFEKSMREGRNIHIIRGSQEQQKYDDIDV